jgi:hypothetical protein
MRKRFLPLAPLFLSAFVACGGSAFKDATGSGGAGGSAGTGIADGAAGAVADAPGTSDGPIVCSPLGADAADVYVDKRFRGKTPTGTATCPWPTILDATNAPLTVGVARTIHVAGANPALVYSETTRVLVGVGITLLGDGPAKTTISASGMCASKLCAVHVLGSGSIDGFTVTSPQGSGIVTGALLSAARPAVIRNVSAVDSAANGILTLGQAEIGPAIVANHNGLPNSGHGLSIEGSGLVVVRSNNQTINQFDNNAWHGINVAGDGLLQFEGGEATGNGNNGVRFDLKAAQPPAVHVIKGLKAANNPNNGVAVYGGSVKVRSSTLLGNKRTGLFFGYTAGSQLDLGTPQDPGGNVFGGKTPAGNNVSAGIALCNAAGAPVAQAAEGDQWSACPPLQTAVTSCDIVPAGYSDVVTGPAGSVTVTAVSCAAGP